MFRNFIPWTKIRSRKTIAIISNSGGSLIKLSGIWLLLKPKPRISPSIFLQVAADWLRKQPEILNPNFIRLFTVSPTEQDFTGLYLIFGNVFVSVLSPQGKQDLCLKFYGSRIESTSSQHTPKAFLATEPKSYISTHDKPIEQPTKLARYFRKLHHETAEESVYTWSNELSQRI